MKFRMYLKNNIYINHRSQGEDLSYMYLKPLGEATHHYI